MRVIRIAAVVAFAFAIAAGAAAQHATKPADSAARKKVLPAKKTETQADLLKEAKISMDSARKIALARVAGSTVRSEEIEREHGRLIYSFDLKRAGHTGIEEVNVNALTGAVVGGVEHESPKTERKEAKVEAREKAAKK